MSEVGRVNGQRSPSSEPIRADDPIKFDTDVLVLGGGPAGAWAAYGAASRGARVTLVDKGYLGSSGATAPGGNNVLYVEPDQKLRDEAVASRMAQGGYLSEARWIHRILDNVYEQLKLVEQWGYPFPKDEYGNSQRSHLQGPEYMKLMRNVVKKAGVRILDQSPALELLVDSHGVGGARGVSRLEGLPWEIRASAVVIATGGCAFLAGGLGCNVLTGEGLLMAAELGAELSGMEFARHYAPSAGGGTVTRGRTLGWGTFSREDGTVVDRRGDPDALARALLDGPVYAVLDKADTPEKRRILRGAHAIFFLPLDRAGFDPFTQRFPVTLRYEGTVRGVGGIRITGDDCSTTIPGLYAAGDAASRQLVTGASSGGGAFNAAWALSSGGWSGEAAAQYALSLGRKPHERTLQAAGRAGVQSASTGSASIETAAVIKAVQSEVFPLEINYFRSVPVLEQSLRRLNALWPAVNGAPGTSADELLRSREAAAMVQTARWSHTAALARTETRGMHTFAEYPDTDPRQQRRLTTAGVETIRVRPEGLAPASAHPEPHPISWRKAVAA
ncbi:oxidoreductase [Capsulimonas corticalis]|uniref:Oxidoreductase n=1 Tax=Capsulimonas corticalis TaxID=2219043 RepID=A0A402CSG1_9BACT|nr:FAD-binding protein [Capsulimonas corticalis]BDI31105.1 oxidoreductase [Capsulimonas corticalis]